MQDPERYLKTLKIPVRCIVHRQRDARLDPATRIVIGHDVFFFSDSPARHRFVANPLRYCRRLTDPVTLVRFAPNPRSPHLRYRGRGYYFADVRSLATFPAHPDSFAVRRGM